MYVTVYEWTVVGLCPVNDAMLFVDLTYMSAFTHIYKHMKI